MLESICPSCTEPTIHISVQCLMMASTVSLKFSLWKESLMVPPGVPGSCYVSYSQYSGKGTENIRHSSLYWVFAGKKSVNCSILAYLQTLHGGKMLKHSSPVVDCQGGHPFHCYCDWRTLSNRISSKERGLS